MLKSISAALLFLSLILFPLLTYASQGEPLDTADNLSSSLVHAIYLPLTIREFQIIPTETERPIQSPTLTDINQPTPIQSVTPENSPSPTSEMPTVTATTVATNQPTATPSPSATPSVTPSVTSTPSLTPEPTVTPSQTSEPPDGMIWINRHSVELFESIPLEYLQAAGNMTMLFSDRSVGQNINEGLDCLTATSWGESPAHCRRDYYNEEWEWRTFTQEDLDQGLVPERILFDPDPVLFNRDNWTFVFDMGTWSELTQSFIQVIAPQYLDTKEALSYQFSYLNVTENDDIADPQVGYFSVNPERYTVFDYEAFIAQHPDKIFFFWTTSLARSIGTQVSTDFNVMMRDYAVEHEKILFDVADILSYTDLGEPCYDNLDGVQPAICQDYTTEVDGGHLGSVSGGKIRVAKAFWVLMARIAGWDGQPEP